MTKIFLFLAVLGTLATAQARPNCETLAAEAAKTLWALNSGIDMKLLKAEVVGETQSEPKFHKVVVSSKLSKDVNYRVITNAIPKSSSCFVMQVTMEEGYQ